MFKEMDQDTLITLLDQEQDILTPMIEADNELYNDTACTRCGGSTYPENDLSHLRVSEDGTELFSASSRPIPKKLCRCADCKSLIDPFSGIIVELGNLALIEPRIPIIRPK
jgi:hypothetical protein